MARKISDESNFRAATQLQYVSTSLQGLRLRLWSSCVHLPGLLDTVDFSMSRPHLRGGGGVLSIPKPQTLIL